MVSNRYNLLTPFLQSFKHIQFFNLTLEAKNQPLFAFKWPDPDQGFSGQLTWTRLPQKDTSESKEIKEAPETLMV